MGSLVSIIRNEGTIITEEEEVLRDIPPLPRKVLFAFDCDQTLLDGDSDEGIASMLKLPEEISALFDGYNWLPYMNAVFKYLHEKGVGIEEISETLKRSPFTKGILELIHTIMENDANQILVISDANDFSIRIILKTLVPDRHEEIYVISNKASLSNKGMLKLTPCHEGQVNCDLCPRNLCKGKALLDYIRGQETPFEKVVYVGDGRNDYCPAVKGADLILVRKGYKLHALLLEKEIGETNNNDDDEYNTDYSKEDKVIKIWEDGFQIKEILRSLSILK